METRLQKCQRLCFFFAKELNLTFDDFMQMSEDLCNLRGDEWQETIDKLNDEGLSEKWREWSANGGPAEVVPV